MHSANKNEWGYLQEGHSQGERGEIPPPPKPKNCCRTSGTKGVKNCVISESSIFSNKFSKKNKNKKFNFSKEFSSKNFKISQQFVFFVQTRKK